MTKKMKREQKPTAVSDEVVAEMDVRLAYQNLIETFSSDQQALEEKVQSIESDAAPHTQAPEENVPPVHSDVVPKIPD